MAFTIRYKIEIVDTITGKSIYAYSESLRDEDGEIEEFYEKPGALGDATTKYVKEFSAWLASKGEQ